VYESLGAANGAAGAALEELSVDNSPSAAHAGRRFFVLSITPNHVCGGPQFRVGYAQTWQLAVQRDMPAALQLTATYLG